MELLPLGPITIIDTPGLDDEGDLESLVRGALSVEKLSDGSRVLIAYLQGILPRCLGPIPGAGLFLNNE